MFDVGFVELLVIGVVALLVLGPERLPAAARTVGGLLRRARSSWNSLRGELEREFAAEELKRSIGNTARQLDLSADLRKATEGLDPLAAVKSATANAAAPAPDAAPATTRQPWSRRRRPPASAPRMTESLPEGDREQPFIAHLVELRNRLLRAVAAVLVVFVALVPFANRLYSLLAAPLLAKLPQGTQMVAIDVATPFLTPIKLAFFAAIVVAMPYLLFQAWAFVAPGLYRHEKRLATPLLVSAIVLFYVGCAFAYFLVMPVVFGFLTATVPEGVAMMTDISHYLDFVLVLFLAFGLCFQVPVAVVILVILGVATPATLARSRPYVIVGAFVVGAVLTPPDVLSQVMLAVPMCLLYEVGILAARAITRDREARAARSG